MGPALKHEALLFVSCSHQIHAVFLRFGQFHAVLYELDDVSHIPPDVLKLFSDGGTDRLYVGYHYHFAFSSGYAIVEGSSP